MGEEGLGRGAGGGELQAGCVSVQAERPVLGPAKEEALWGLELFGCNERWTLLCSHTGPCQRVQKLKRGIVAAATWRGLT
jgi:hypothetical protein